MTPNPRKGPVRTVIGFWSDRPFIDPIIVFLFLVIYWFLRRWGPLEGRPLVVLTGPEQIDLARDLLTASLALVGIGLTPVAVIIALAPGKRMAAFEAAHGRKLGPVVGWALWATLLTAVVSFAVVLFRPATSGPWPLYAMCFAAGTMTLELARLIDLFAKMIPVIIRDRTEKRAEHKKLKEVEVPNVDAFSGAASTEKSAGAWEMKPLRPSTSAVPPPG